ncbi:MAG: hypothetical protein QOF58_5643 [Pseudonocardiales bacterium]|jgi:hypothetical protein|nr:hypothetical protein [Pseudonocardiales bacterium]
MVHRIHELEPEFIARRLIPDKENEPFREELRQLLARWVDSTVPDPHNPLHHLQTADAVQRLVEDLAEHEVRKAALFCLADGQSAAEIGRELSLSRWALAKRWPDLAGLAKPYRWFPHNHVEWYKWVSELLKRAPESEAAAALDRELEPYRRAIWDWWLLLKTPELVRAVFTAWRPEPGHQMDHNISVGLTELFTSYDATREATTTPGATAGTSKEETK